MRVIGHLDPSDEIFNRLYLDHRVEAIKYAARLIRGEAGSNTHILGVEAAEIYDEAMSLYYKAQEHLADRSDHSRYIKRRIQQCVIGWIRKKTSAKRTPPNGPVVSLDAPTRDEAETLGESMTTPDVRDEHSRFAEQEIDLTDAVDRIAVDDERKAAAARLSGKTFDEIAAEAGISEEAARQRVKRAGEYLRDDL